MLRTDYDGWNLEVSLPFRHKDVGPGTRAAYLSVHDGRVAELAARADKLVFVERRGIGFGIDRGIDRDFQRK